MRIKMAFDVGHPKKLKEKGGHAKHFEMARCFSIKKKCCYKTNIERRTQSYYKHSICFKKTLGNEKHL